MLPDRSTVSEHRLIKVYPSQAILLGPFYWVIILFLWLSSIDLQVSMPQMHDFLLCEKNERGSELENIHSLHFKRLNSLSNAFVRIGFEHQCAGTYRASMILHTPPPLPWPSPMLLVLLPSPLPPLTIPLNLWTLYCFRWNEFLHLYNHSIIVTVL